MAKAPTSSPSYEAGRRMGWLMAAHTHTAISLPRLRKEVNGYVQTMRDYVKETHPDATVIERDAMRHAFVSAKVTLKNGPDYATYLGYCTESVRDITGSNIQQDRGMDLHNNKVASDFACAHPNMTDRQFLDAFWNELGASLIVSHDDPRVHERSYHHDNHIASRHFETIKSTSHAIHAPFKKIFGSKKHHGKDLSNHEPPAPGPSR